MRALILSAGLGERLRPLTLKRAKPAIEFLNMPMLAFPYYWLDTLGLTHVVCNTHYLAETIRRAAMSVVRPETALNFTFEDEILGSGGGIWNARFQLQADEDFAVANGDAVVTFDRADTIARMLAAHRTRGALATLLVCPLEGVGTRIPGVWLTADGAVTNFGKAGAGPGTICRHYASFMFFSERVWKYIPAGSSNILYDVLQAAIAQGELVLGFEESAMQWFETGNVADYLAATDACLGAMAAGTAAGLNLRAMLDRFQPSWAVNSDLARKQLLFQSAKITGFGVVAADATGVGLVENGVVLPGATASGEVRNTVVI